MSASARSTLLVTGGAGLLGAEVVARLAGGAGARLVATTHRTAPPPGGAGAAWEAFELLDPDAPARIVARVRPRAIVHAALPSAPADFHAGIVRASARLALAAREAGAAFLHVSSDMVFDGAHGPFAEDAPPSPVTDYGRAKADAEAAVRAACPEAFVVRSSLLYRLAPPDPALARWLAGLATGEAYPLFEDEIRCPAPVADVARALADLALAAAGLAAPPAPLPPAGQRTFHCVGPVAVSRWEFGTAILRALGRDPGRARRARLAGSGLVRPRELVLLRRRTPAWLVAGIRGPAEFLGVPVRPHRAAPGGPPGARPAARS